jgi:large-conductance mechanosensitive channel
MCRAQSVNENGITLSHELLLYLAFWKAPKQQRPLKEQKLLMSTFTQRLVAFFVVGFVLFLVQSCVTNLMQDEVE